MLYENILSYHVRKTGWNQVSVSLSGYKHVYRLLLRRNALLANGFRNSPNIMNIYTAREYTVAGILLHWDSMPDVLRLSLRNKSTPRTTATIFESQPTIAIKQYLFQLRSNQGKSPYKPIRIIAKWLPYGVLRTYD